MKKTWKRILSSALMLCMMISCLTVSASAATRYDAQAALQYAADHWNDGQGLCAEFVSNCIRAGGLSSWSRECTDLYGQLVREVVERAQIATVQELVTSGNRIPADANWGRVSAGDVIWWVCDGCLRDDSGYGTDFQHVAIVSSVDDSGIRITQHNNARYNVVATVNSCYCCGRRYSRLVVLHFNDYAAAPEPAAPEQFDCNVQINCTAGQQVNLYRNAGDTQRITYFSRGQTAYATQGANVNGETWFRIQALDNKGQPTWYWLKANANGVTVIDQTPQPPQQEQQQQESPSSSRARAYFDCDAEIRTTSGVTVDLYRNPGDTTRATYFSKGQTCWASKGLKAEDGTVWYQVQAMDGGQAKTFWLNAGSAGVTVTEHGPTNSWITADILSMDLSLSSNPSGLVRLDFSEKRISGGYQGDDLGLQPEWVDVGDNWAVARFTATRTGSCTYTFNIVPEDGSQGAWVTFQINVAP